MNLLSRIVCCLILLALSLSGCSPGGTAATAPARIGYPASPLLGVLYAAETEHPSGAHSWETRPMGSGGDVGYALASGKLEAGFMETAKAIRLVKSPAGKELRLAGAVTFPYGAVLVIRKGLNIRLDELPGKKLAAEDADCKLFHQFRRDVQRQGVSLARVRFSYVPFADMLPALEAGAVDGMVTKGVYGLLAELQGHTILYQNWELKPGGDECCPESLAQIEYFLVVRDDALERVKPFIASLDRASALPPSRIRRAMCERLGIASEKLGRFPVATFAALDGKLRREVGERRCIPR